MLLQSLKQQFTAIRLALLIGVYIPLQIFAVLAVYIRHSSEGLVWDSIILQSIHAAATPQLDHVARMLTGLGVFWGVLPASVIIGVGLLYRQKWRSLLFLSATLLGSAAINLVAKLLFHRGRPQLWQPFSPELDYSFPSGHAMSSLSFVLVLAILTWDSRWRWPVVGIGSGFVGIIGWTRLYLGVHYPSDILAGWLLALAWAVGVRLLIPQPHDSCDRAEILRPTPGLLETDRPQLEGMSIASSRNKGRIKEVPQD
jgi:membrane-associated phospholipid phosphatase